ncbi:TRAP transporter small permease [Psychrobacillus sp. FJAT-51614]|uniref:TRAP transporter small permease n=1 Tax=Psychrobacillus mangrovi TaxID=3117745 RepID=A0ABU8F4X6_9BACI
MRAFSEKLNLYTGYLVVILVAVLLTVTTIEVFFRNVLNSSIHWSEELSRFTLVWTTFIGASVVYKKGELIALNAFTKLNEKKRKIIFYITQVITIFFTILLIYFSIHATLSPSTMNQFSPGLNISMAIPYLSIPLGLFIMLIHEIAFLLDPKELFDKEGEYE